MRISFKPGMLLTMAAAFVSLLALTPCRADDIQTTVAINKMLCIQPTETGLNNRDEVYVIVKTESPDGHEAKRLPRPDDYYEFWKGTQGEVRGWTDQDQLKQGDPILFRGNLAPGQSARVLVVIGEQDNKDLAAIGRLLIKIAELGISGASDALGEPEIGAGVSAALGKMSDLIKDGHDDVIGCFGLVLKNEDGKLREQWIPGKFAVKGESEGAFQCHGTSNSAYNLHVKVTEKSVAAGTPLPTRRVFLGTEIDRCGEPSLKVQSLQGAVEVHKGETKEVRVPSNRFWWYCANSQEWTTAPASTNLVIVTRGTDDRKITWKCYREE